MTKNTMLYMGSCSSGLIINECPKRLAGSAGDMPARLTGAWDTGPRNPRHSCACVRAGRRRAVLQAARQADTQVYYEGQSSPFR